MVTSSPSKAIQTGPIRYEPVKTEPELELESVFVGLPGLALRQYF